MKIDACVIENERLLGGGNGGAGGIFDGMLVGAPGGADEIDDVELSGDPKRKICLNIRELS